MKIYEVLKQGVRVLEEHKIPDAEFDALCLLEKAFDFNRNLYYFNKLNDADVNKSEVFLSYVSRRISGEPLQYILGKWEFMTGEFYVGDGVLIPRQDTEILVETVAEYIKTHNVKTIVDLCAGSGCIGISLAMMFPEIEVFSIELSDKAFYYLEKNIELNEVENVKAINGDIVNGLAYFGIEDIDILVSNPPYIETEEIKTLSVEVQNEPFMALDGGKDGYFFYKIIKEKWLSLMKKESFAVFECGENQAGNLAEIFSDISTDTKIVNDLNDVQRVVSIIKN